MSTGPDPGGPPVRDDLGGGGKYRVDARGAMGVQVGEGNTQIIYTYNRLTWTDGVAPPPLAGVSGVIYSPYRGLSAFEERDAASVTPNAAPAASAVTISVIGSIPAPLAVAVTTTLRQPAVPTP